MMNSIIKHKKILLILFTIHFSLFTLVGCGYKPTSHYSKEQIKGDVFVEVVINLEDPKNSVLVKDALNEIVVSKFDRKLVYDKDSADTVLIIELESVNTDELQKDKDGYVNLYRTNVNISIKYSGPGGKGKIEVEGSYDFSVDDGSTISDVKRFEAIKIAANKALEEVVSKFAIESFRKDK